MTIYFPDNFEFDLVLYWFRSLPARYVADTPKGLGSPSSPHIFFSILISVLMFDKCINSAQQSRIELINRTMVNGPKLTANGPKITCPAQLNVFILCPAPPPKQGEVHWANAMADHAPKESGGQPTSSSGFLAHPAEGPSHPTVLLFPTHLPPSAESLPTGRTLAGYTARLTR